MLPRHAAYFPARIPATIISPPGPGGARALAAENPVLKQQLLIIGPPEAGAPNLLLARRAPRGLPSASGHRGAGEAQERFQLAPVHPAMDSKASDEAGGKNAPDLSRSARHADARACSRRRLPLDEEFARGRNKSVGVKFAM